MTFSIGAKSKKMKILIAMVSIIFCAVLILGGFTLYGKYQMGKIPDLTFMEALAYTTRNNPYAVITVGIIRNGEISYKVYGENAVELPAQLHTYEIGSLTKTFTAALISKAITEGKISIDDTIDNYLPLSGENQYPTVKELLTHTSGYKGFYFERPMISNFLKGKNDFYGITKEMVYNKANDLNMDENSYDFTYSNFGYAVLGLVLEAIYNTDYITLVNDFTQNELGLANTRISDNSGNLGNYWDWKDDDAYLSAGAITSNILDMLSYAQMQLESSLYFAECHKSLQEINATTESYHTLGIHMDRIGMAWIIDNENDIVWHNGGTGAYNSYLGFDIDKGNAVVVLSNLSPSYRIPATILGVKLLAELDR